jgi:dipeptidase E
MGNHLGETRDRRIAEFLEQNDVPVLGLCEGAWLAVREGSATVGGLNGARLFQRGARSIEPRTNDDLSYLMAVGGTFDAPLPPTGDIDPRPDPPLAKAADPFQ